MPRKYTSMAIIYDFDGTLSPGNVQEHQFIPGIGMKPKEFWAEVECRSKKHKADEILMYMHLTLEKNSLSSGRRRLTAYHRVPAAMRLPPRVRSRPCTACNASPMASTAVSPAPGCIASIGA